MPKDPPVQHLPHNGVGGGEMMFGERLSMKPRMSMKIT